MGVLATSIDWTQVLLLGVPAYIAALGAAAAAIIAALNRRGQRVPSGGHIGAKVEQAAELTAANAASLKQLHERLNGENVLPLRPPDASAADA